MREHDRAPSARGNIDEIRGPVVGRHLLTVRYNIHMLTQQLFATIGAHSERPFPVWNATHDTWDTLTN